MAKRGGFPGGMPGNMNNIMKQAQKMQKQMEEATKELQEKEVTSSAENMKCQTLCGFRSNTRQIG